MVTIEDAREVAGNLAAKLSPVAVLLFGSVARSGKGTDLDMLIVTEQEDMQETVSLCLREYCKLFPIDYVVASSRMLNKKFRGGSPFLNLIQKEGRILYMKSTLNEWIDFAKEDFRQATYLLKGDFYRGACFAAQQSVEKTLKAALLKKGWNLEKIVTVHGFKRSEVQGCFMGPLVSFRRQLCHKWPRIRHFKRENRRPGGRLLTKQCLVACDSGL